MAAGYESLDSSSSRFSLTVPVISFDAKNRDNKRANTKWIRDLNEIRKITTHPERGVLTTDQVAFVNEVFDKVEKYFPEDILQRPAFG